MLSNVLWNVWNLDLINFRKFFIVKICNFILLSRNFFYLLTCSIPMDAIISVILKLFPNKT